MPKVNIFKKAAANLKYKRAKAKLRKATHDAAKAWNDAVKSAVRKHKHSKKSTPRRRKRRY